MPEVHIRSRQNGPFCPCERQSPRILTGNQLVVPTANDAHFATFFFGWTGLSASGSIQVCVTRSNKWRYSLLNCERVHKEQRQLCGPLA